MSQSFNFGIGITLAIYFTTNIILYIAMDYTTGETFGGNESSVCVFMYLTGIDC